MNRPKPLRIAQVAPLWFPVPPKLYGGIERVVSLLTEELVMRGHEVTLFAAPGSETAAELVHVYDKPLVDAGYAWDQNDWNLRNLACAFEMAREGAFDLVHSHLDKLSLFFHGLAAVPVIHTLHGNLIAEDPVHADPDRYRLFAEESDRAQAVFISRASREISDIKFSHSHVVLNAVDVNHFVFSPRSGDHFIWIARIDPEKGLENAILAAERLGCKLLFAGRIDPRYRDYFNTRIKPHLSSRIQYVGELAQTDLPSFYGSALAMIYPIEWEEPFGLVVAEAMACGTPVIAYRRGAMPEIIADGVSGYVTEPRVEALIEGMKRAERLQREAVRRHAVSLFRQARMADDYEAVYEKVLPRTESPLPLRVSERRYEPRRVRDKWP